MSLEDYDARFPGQKATGLPPSPSRENPGQVFPKTDPEGSKAHRPLAPFDFAQCSRHTAAPAHPVRVSEREPLTLEALGNPYVLNEFFTKLDHALTDAITAIQGEERSVGAASSADALVRKFSSWRDELTQIRTGHGEWGVRAALRDANDVREQQDGGLFTD